MADIIDVVLRVLEIIARPVAIVVREIIRNRRHPKG